MPAGQIIRAGQIPGERLSPVSIRTANFTGITTTETAIDWATVSLVAGRTYKVRWTVAWGSTVAGDTVFGRIREDSVTGNQLMIMRTNIPATGGVGTRWDGTIEAEYTATATGSKGFYGTGVRATGTGSISAQGDPSFPILLYVEYVRG